MTVSVVQSVDEIAASKRVSPLLPKTSSSSSCRSEEHTSELQSLMRTSYALFCLKKKNSSQPQAQKTVNKTNHSTGARPRQLQRIHHETYHLRQVQNTTSTKNATNTNHQT